MPGGATLILKRAICKVPNFRYNYSIDKGSTIQHLVLQFVQPVKNLHTLIYPGAIYTQCHCLQNKKFEKNGAVDGPRNIT